MSDGGDDRSGSSERFGRSDSGVDFERAPQTNRYVTLARTPGTKEYRAAEQRRARLSASMSESLAAAAAELGVIVPRDRFYTTEDVTNGGLARPGVVPASTPADSMTTQMSRSSAVKAGIAEGRLAQLLNQDDMARLLDGDSAILRKATELLDRAVRADPGVTPDGREAVTPEPVEPATVPVVPVIQETGIPDPGETDSVGVTDRVDTTDTTDIDEQAVVAIERMIYMLNMTGTATTTDFARSGLPVRGVEVAEMFAALDPIVGARVAELLGFVPVSAAREELNKIEAAYYAKLTEVETLRTEMSADAPTEQTGGDQSEVEALKAELERLSTENEALGEKVATLELLASDDDTAEQREQAGADDTDSTDSAEDFETAEIAEEEQSDEDDPDVEIDVVTDLGEFNEGQDDQDVSDDGLDLLDDGDGDL